MSETLYGIELGTLRQAISAHELQGYENLGPYIFTKVSNKKVGESSSGFGPGQITATTAEDMLRRYPSLFADEGFKTYVNKFIVQGTNKLNIDYYNSLYKDRRRQRTTKNDRQIFGPLGKGNISEEDHNKYYTKLFNIVIRDKAKNADNLDSFLKNYHGAGEGKEQQNIDYSKSVRQKLKDLGISISGASDPKQFQGERVTPLPEPKPDKPKMAMPVPKPERDSDQFIDQPGEIADTGEGPDMDDKSTYEKVKPYIPFLRHLNEGGMTLAKQMELFDEGGLKDEGGTTDPISGNEVPSGSLQEEVRDDIPAQLSEGEFVFPADVVRYIGLEKLMQMRQEAKMGLAMMERMGQMGNGDEAVVSDDIPFELSDLDITDEPEYNVGGFVPGQTNPFGIAGTQQSAFAGGVGGFIPYEMPQFGQTPMPQAYAPPVQQSVPILTTPTPLPTPEQFLPETPTDPTVTTVEYINPETGEKRIITFIGGQPTIAIPEGFIPMDEYTPEDATTATPTTEVATTTVTDTDDNEPPQSAAEIAEMRARVAAAKRLGITEQVGFSIAGAFGRYNPEDVGKFTPTGYIIGKGGVLLDPLTGKTEEQNSPSMIAGILNAISGGKEPPKPAYSDDFFDAMPDQAKDVLGRSLGKEARDTRIAEAQELRQQTEARIAKAAEEARQKALKEKRAAEVAESMARAAEEKERKRIREEKAAEIAAEQQKIAEVQRRAREEMAARENQRERQERIQRESEERQKDRDRGGSGETAQERGDRHTAERVAEAVSTGDYSRGFVEGGLAAKKKPKVKKMKRGGLASKK